MLADGDKGVILQRDKRTYAVAPHLVCGMADPATLRVIADVAEKYKLAIKVTGEQRIALIGIKPEDVDAVWAELGIPQGHVVGNTVRGVKVCPGTDFCKRAMQDSMSVGRVMDKRYHGMAMPGKMKLGVSGCVFQCSETNFKDIGLVGKPKGWTVLVGGNGGSRPRIGETLVENLPTEEALDLVDRLVRLFQSSSNPSERMGRFIDRLGGLSALREQLGLGDAANEPAVALV